MAGETTFDITVEGRGEWTVVRVAGDLDMATAPRLESTCEPTEAAIALDLAGVRFIDSSGLRALLRILAGCPRLVLLCPSAAVQRLLSLTQTADSFRVADGFDSLRMPA